MRATSFGSQLLRVQRVSYRIGPSPTTTTLEGAIMADLKLRWKTSRYAVRIATRNTTSSNKDRATKYQKRTRATSRVVRYRKPDKSTALISIALITSASSR